MTTGHAYVEVRETHAGVVFRVGDRAYKLKKPVDLGFLDFTTLAARRRICHREVELNRRLAPDVYLGVADVHDPHGRPCEHLVVMRWMPDDRRLSTLVRAGAPVADDLRRLARLLAAFHSRTARRPEIADEGRRDALRDRWVASFEQTRPYRGTVLPESSAEEVERLALRFLGGRAALFDARADDGRVVDGHGDLMADDVFCLDDGPRPLDCLEFDDRLRWLDALDDASFLAMDLERLGAADLAHTFLEWYVDFAGDPAPASLRHHYVAYRAFVRAKVACLRHDQGGEDAAAEARLLTTMAVRHLRAGAVELVLVGGLPGTGKSTVAGGIADRLNITLLSSDRIRKELAGISPQTSASSPYGEGVYSADHTDRTYAELLNRAEKLLSHGESVVLDASWNDGRRRDAAVALAERLDADLAALRCVAPTELTAERLRRRRGDVSDADEAVAEAMAAHADPWPEATVLDTRQPVETSVAAAVTAVRPPVDRAPAV